MACYPYPAIGRMLVLAALLASSGCAGSASDPARADGPRQEPGRSAPPAAGGGAAAGGLAEGVDPARALTALERIEPAVAAPVRPAELKPLPARAAEQMEAGAKLAAEQRYTEASLEIEKALRFAPNHPDVQRALAELHLASGSLERARTHAAKALEGNPDDARLHVLIGSIDAQSGHDEEALTALRTALLCSDLGAVPGTEARARYELSTVLARLGYVQAALEQRQRVAAMPAAALAAAKLDGVLATTEARLFVPGLLEQLGRHAEAADGLRAVVASAPGDDALALRYARLLSRAGRNDEALTVARGIRTRQAEVISLLTEIHQASGHPERLVEDLTARLPTATDPEDVIALVDALAASGRGKEAAAALSARVAAGPPSVRLTSRLVDLHVEQKDWPAAVAAVALAIEQEPERALALADRLAPAGADPAAVDRVIQGATEGDGESLLLARGLVAWEANRRAEAVALLERSLAKKPGFVPARVALGRAHVAAYRYEDALSVAKRTNPDEAESAGLEVVLGLAYDALDRGEDAERHLRAAIQLDRQAVEARYVLAQTYLTQGKRNQAAQQLRVIADEVPGHEGACELLAGIYLGERKVGDALKLYEKLAESSKEPMVVARARAMAAQFRSPDPAAYRKAMQDAISSGTPDAAVWIALAESYDDLEAEPAREAYLAAMKLDPTSERGALGLIHAEQGLLHFEAAIGLWKELLPRRPNRDSWRLEAGGAIDTCLAVEDFDTALSIARQMEGRAGLEAETKIAYRQSIIRILLEAKRVDEVIAQVQAWISAEPDEWRWRRVLAGVYVEHERAVEAVPILEKLHTERPDSEAIFELLLETLVDVGQAERAAQYALGRLYEDPDSDSLLAMLLIALEHAKRYDDAIELVRNKLELASNKLRYQDALVTLLAASGRRDEAVEMVESLLEEEIERGAEGVTIPALQDRLIDLLFTAGEYDEAQRRLAFWLSEARDVATQLRWLVPVSVCQDALGDAEGAARTKEQALSLNPDSVVLNNDLAYSWINRGVRADEAELRIRYAVSRSPRQAAYLDTYGWLLYKKERFEEACTWLGRALRAPTGSDPVIADHLGDACWRAGRREEAAKRWQEAVELLKEIENRPMNADEKRVSQETVQKLEDVAAGREPKTASPGFRAVEPSEPTE